MNRREVLPPRIWGASIVIVGKGTEVAALDDCECAWEPLAWAREADSWWGSTGCEGWQGGLGGWKEVSMLDV